MKAVAKNAGDIYNFRNKIINTIKKEMAKHIDEAEKEVDLDDLLYNGINKLIELKNEYDSENEKFKKDHNIKKGRDALERFIDNTLDGKFTDKKDLLQEYLEKVKPYKDKLENKQRYSGSNFSKLLEYIQRIEFAVFGKLDIATDGQDNLRKSVIESIPKLGDQEEPSKPGEGLKIMTPSQLITRLPILLAQKQAGNNSQKLKNEIKQIIYFLYRSKNLSKTLYNHLINNI